MADETQLLTIGLIAKQAGCSTHQAQHVARSRGIKPIGRAGVLRVFDEDGAARIISELKAISEKGITKANRP